MIWLGNEFVKEALKSTFAAPEDIVITSWNFVSSIGSIYIQLYSS